MSFGFTLPDATEATGVIHYDGSAVTNGRNQLLAVDDLALTVGDTDFMLNDFDDTPTLSFSFGQLSGLSLS